MSKDATLKISNLMNIHVAQKRGSSKNKEMII